LLRTNTTGWPLSKTNEEHIYDVKDFYLTISNISSDRISVNINLITGCLIHFPGRITIPNDLNGMSAHWFLPF